jgi:glycosyltransferase involved in cell wall biosynthesis
MLLSPSEGFPNSVMEMMALGKPVIASNVGGVPELINNGEDGFLVNNNINDITTVLSDIINDPHLKGDIGEKAKSKIYNNFSIHKMTAEFNDIYTNLK